MCILHSLDTMLKASFSNQKHLKLQLWKQLLLYVCINLSLNPQFYVDKTLMYTVSAQSFNEWTLTLLNIQDVQILC